MYNGELKDHHLEYEQKNVDNIIILEFCDQGSIY